MTKDSTEFDEAALNVQKLRQVLGYNPNPNQQDLPTTYAAQPGIYAYDREWQTDLNSLEQKRSSLNTYIQILETIGNGHAALDQASGGEGKGQETYCPLENSDSDSTAHNPQGFITDNNLEEGNIDKYKNYQDELTFSFYIDDFEKLVLELESLHSVYKN